MGDSDVSDARNNIGHILHRRIRRGLWDARPYLPQAADAQLAVRRDAGGRLADCVYRDRRTGRDCLDMDARRPRGRLIAI